MTTRDSSQERASRAPLVAGFAGMSAQTAIAAAMPDGTVVAVLLLAHAAGIALSTAPGTCARSRASAAPLGDMGGAFLAMFLGFALGDWAAVAAAATAPATLATARAIVARSARESA